MARMTDINNVICVGGVSRKGMATTVIDPIITTGTIITGTITAGITTDCPTGAR